MKSSDPIELKKKLLHQCISIQKKVAETARKAMEEAQTSANEEEGSAEEKFESFKAQLQIDRDMFAKQYEEAIEKYNMLTRIDISKVYDQPLQGAVLHTDTENFFISISLGEIKLDDKRYYAISPVTPLFKQMLGKRKGDKFIFRDRTYKINELF
jgi:hypothetical protein